MKMSCSYLDKQDFHGGTVDKNQPANAGYMGSIPDPGQFHMLWGN